MRIDSGKVDPAVVQSSSSERVAAGDKAKASAPSAAVVVSPQTSAAHAATERSGAAHRAHVQHLKALVADGKYSVDYGKLAEKMADDELARAGRK